MLIPRARQTKRFVPSRQLQCAASRILRQCHPERGNQYAIDIVLRLVLGEAKRVHLHTIAKQLVLGIRHAVTLGQNFVPQLDKRAHLRDLGHEAKAGIDEKRDAPSHRAEFIGSHFTRLLHSVEHSRRGRQRKCQFLHRRRACFLQMIRAHVGWVPLLNLTVREHDRILDQLERRLGREHIRSPRQVFLDDVVLNGAGQFPTRLTGLIGKRHVKRQQPRRRGIDRHRRVHLGKWYALQERAHIAQMADRHPDLADLAARQFMVAVVTRLCRQVESDRQPCLPLGKVLAVEGV